MKIGILTYLYNNYNYGGVLQAYALQKELKNLNYNSEQILYDKIIRKEDMCTIRKGCNYIIRSILDKKVSQRKEKFNTFIDSIPHSRYCTSNTITECTREYDVLICGSDQIWNLNWFDDAFFLSFASSNQTKISYAASMGKCAINKEQKKIIKHLLADFNAISVREEKMKSLFDDEHISDSVECVVDPVFLLSRNEWTSLADMTETTLKEPYIFCYMLGSNAYTKKYIKRYAKKKKLRIVTIPYMTGLRNANLYFGDYKIWNAGPNEFLRLIKNANAVFTDSYHACVFSIIFQKEFFYTGRRQNEIDESRIETLFDNLKIKGRIVCSEKDLELAEKNKIDFNEVMHNLEYQRKKSVLFLINSINGARNQNDI